MLPFAFIVLGYLLGSIPFGLILTQAAGLGDIRTIGSGNIGATNVLRTGNKKIAAATLLLDALKGAAAVVMAAGALPDPIAAHQAALWAGLGAVLGHLFPVWLKFKGGKGAATAYGVLIAACWPVGLAAGAVWLVVAATLRVSSVATLISFAAAPILAFALADADLVKLSLSISVLVWVRHHANIRRILSGTEPRIGRGSAKA